jgi:heme-degrading monooxygenase HmoA
MYIVLYSFQLNPGHRDDFIKSWKGLTDLIYKHEGSLGSRLHKCSDQEFIAYAQWPDQETFKNSGNNLPEKAIQYRNLMRSSCLKMEVIQTMEVAEDMLKEKQSE